MNSCRWAAAGGVVAGLLLGVAVGLGAAWAAARPKPAEPDPMVFLGLSRKSAASQWPARAEAGAIEFLRSRPKTMDTDRLVSTLEELHERDRMAMLDLQFEVEQLRLAIEPDKPWQPEAHRRLRSSVEQHWHPSYRQSK